ncbi:tetratricopeptide repeat protein [Thalassoglobus polymorphus]|uniref:Lipoprotein NlpI n=1 Tax=Thalassoglobus polymorphus TaxID=2527994 RepID=A0A517QR16_9PLAN|nr:tetratricopeptide repeat protein [Thalassoglobus polymorphus]QDT34055.1 Lipoprotein NlpI precursor [Thalassoglobus polymorphus]
MTIPIRRAKEIATVLTLLTSFLSCSSAYSQNSVVKLDTVEQYIVQSEKSPVMTGTTRIADASLGALLDVTHHRGPWRYSATVKGWVHKNNLVLISDAVKIFSDQIAKDPTPKAYHLRGISYMAQGNWGRAVNDLEEAYELGDSSITLHINLGTCFQQLKLYDKAEAEYNVILKTYPNEVGAYQARGDLFLDTGKLDAALKDFTKAIELAPESPEAHNSLGVTLRLVGRYPLAIQAYTNCIEADPKFLPAYINRGFAYKNVKKFQLAVDDYEEALKLSPGSPSAQNDLAWLLATCEDESFRDGQRAVDLAVAASRSAKYRNPEYLDTLAAAYAEIGNFEKAIETVQTAIEIFGDGDMKDASVERLELYRQEKSFTDVIEVPDSNADSKSDSSKKDASETE